MSAEIHHIVFDIGQVLIHWDPELPYHNIIPNAQKRAWFFENVCTNEWNLEQDRGRPWVEAEDLLIKTHPEWETEIRAYRGRWHDMVPHAYQQNVGIMEWFIEQGRDVTMLTNFSSDTFREALIRFPFLNKPRGVTVSGDVKLVKPDPAIYDLHTASFDLDPKACLFIDDSAKNISAARDSGWQAIHCLNEEQVKRDLHALGLLI